MSDEPTQEQKRNIATYFIMSAPVGEVDEVVAGQTHDTQQNTTNNKRSFGPTTHATLEIV